MAGIARCAVPASVQIQVAADECFYARFRRNTRNRGPRLFFIRVVPVFRGHQLFVKGACYPRNPRLLENFQELHPEFAGTGSEQQKLQTKNQTKRKETTQMKTFNSHTCRILFATCLSALCLIALSAQAATVTVTNGYDGQPGSLRQVLADANDGDTINFDTSIDGIAVLFGELVVDKSVTILGPDPHTFEVNSFGLSRVFHIMNGVTVSISGLLIMDGYAEVRGGGILNDHSTLTVNNCFIFANNVGHDFGGGICNDGSFGSAHLEINNSSVFGNASDVRGGGIYNNGESGSATLTINNSSVSSNVAGGAGGAIYNDGMRGNATLTINNSILRYNSATYGGSRGGAIFNEVSEGTATVSISNSVLSENSTSDDGGAIYNAVTEGSETLQITKSTLSGNSAGNSGGGIAIYGLGFGPRIALTIDDSTLNGNSAGNTGGGIANSADGQAFTTVTINNSTLSGNSAQWGGGINNGGPDGRETLVINNSTLSGNSAMFGGGIANADPRGGANLTIGNSILGAGASGGNIYNDGLVTSLGYNLSSDDAAGVLTGMGDRINTNPMLGPLQDNGGPTFTHALLTGSPAVDAGKNFTAVTTDQRGPGFLRTFDNASIANANGGDGTDIGAYEVQNAPSQYAASIQQPINADGTSVFNSRRGVVPVKFTLTVGGVATCTLPAATIAVTRTAGGVIGPIDESEYNGSADNGSNFRIANCQYAYNLSTGALGAGTYRVDITINGQVVGNATFGLR